MTVAADDGYVFATKRPKALPLHRPDRRPDAANNEEEGYFFGAS